MAVFIALLRGINVGGNNKISMAELKRVLLAAGFERVQTYIQSGNVLFESDKDAESLRSQFQAEVKSAFGIACSVLLRTHEEWKQIIAACPYDPIELQEKWTIQLTLLDEQLPQAKRDMLQAVNPGPDEYCVDDRRIYFLFRQSMLDTNYAPCLQKLGTGSTTRNWNTVRKLNDMATAMQG
ncbi:DUF1697 domain-containing protein [Paenibacillus cymbidii]|uniref:DUF1697 domain-containing protein n=1 Tax=Paenibacillus cymbidii TaxID=1639034 RepID=UPI0010808946|nr:DUF1697 domain-containing protein [Paenibacillus cymbidii]